ncbi:MAG: hypothetical protein ACK5JC_01480 [Bacteroidota bacterium]
MPINGISLRLYLAGMLALVFLNVFSVRAQDSFGSEKELRNKASKYFKNDDFASCLPLYSQLLSLYPKEAEYNYRYGVCLLMAGKEKEKSIAYLSNASKSTDAEMEVFFYLGKACHLNYRFDEAIQHYNTYRSKASDKKTLKYDVDRQIEMCKNGKSLLQTITDLTVVQKNQFPTAEYFRAYDLGTAGIKIIAKPDDLRSTIDKKKNESGIIVINPNHPYIYFSSYGEVDKGEKDLYRILKTDNFTWSRAKPLSNVINTPYDEDYPFVTSDGKSLFFSSKGHNSMGGYDVFRAVFDSLSGSFQIPINIDFAINTPDDDMLYISDSQMDFAFFSSRRSTDAGNITVFKIKKERVPGKIVLVRGSLAAGEDKSHPSTKITIRNQSGNHVVSTIKPNKAGFYQLILRQGLEYQYTIETEGYQAITKSVSIPENSETAPLIQEIALSKSGGTDEASISSVYQQGPPDESTQQAITAFFRERANLDVNMGQQINEGLLLASKPTEATKPKTTANPNDALIETARKDATETREEAKVLQNRQEELFKLSKQKADSADIMAGLYANSKTPAYKKQEDLYRLKSSELLAQANEAQEKYKEKKAEADWQDNYTSRLETAVKSGDNAEIAKLKTTRFDKEKDMPAKEEAKEVAVEKGSSADLAQQIAQLRKDQAGLTHPEDKDRVQKQIDALTQEKNSLDKKSETTQGITQNTNTGNDIKSSDIATPKTVVTDNLSSPAAAGDAYAQLSGAEKILRDADALKKRAARTADPAQKVKMLKEAETQVRRGQEEKIKSESRLIAEQTASIQKTNDELNSATLPADPALSGKLNQENKTMLADAENLRQQAASEKNPSVKAKKLESARILQEKVISNQQRLLQEVNAAKEKQAAYAAERIKESEELVQQATAFEQKSTEVLASAEPIREALRKDEDNAQNLRSYAAGLKNKTKKADAESAALSYDKSAAIKRQSIDSIQKIADNYAANARTLKSRAEDVRDNANKPPAPEITIPETKPETVSMPGNGSENIASANSSLSSSSKAINATSPSAAAGNSSEEQARYASARAAIDEFKRQYGSLEQEISSLRTSGNEKIEKSVQVLETAQEAGKKERKAAIKEAMALDASGNDELAKADSLERTFSSAKTKKEEAMATLKSMESSLGSSGFAQLQQQYNNTSQSSPAINSAENTSSPTTANAKNTAVTGENSVNAAKASGEATDVNTNPIASQAENTKQTARNLPKASVKYPGYVPGEKVEGLGYSADELLAIITSKAFNDYTNLRQEADSANFFYEMFGKKSQTLSDTVKIIASEAADLMEQAEDVSKDEAKSLKSQAKQKEALADKILARADSIYSESEKLSKIIDTKDNETIRLIQQLDGREASNYKVIYDKISRKEFYSNSPLVEKYFAAFSQTRQRQIEAAQAEALKKAQVAANAASDVAKPADKESNAPTANRQAAVTKPADKETNAPITNKQEFVNTETNNSKKNLTEQVNNAASEKKIAAANNASTAQVYAPGSIQYDVPLPAGIVFRIQVGAYNRRVNNNPFGDRYPLFGRQVNNLVVYSAGMFNNLPEAQTARDFFRGNGQTDAFITAYCNGERISVRQAMIYIRRGTGCDNQPLPESQLAQNGVGVDRNAIPDDQQGNLKQFTELLYTVQVGVYRTLVPASRLYNLSPLYYDTIGRRLIRYSVGIYNNRKDAADACRTIVDRGIKDAFVIPYYNKRRISLEESNRLQRERGEDVLVKGSFVNAKPGSGPAVISQQASVNLSNEEKANVKLRVQIGVFRKDVPVETMNVFLKLAPKGIDVSKSADGLTTYTIGNFNTLAEVENLRREAIAAGLDDAFVVGFAGNRKISVEQAKTILGIK